MKMQEILEPMRTIQGSEASSALRVAIWAERKNWMQQVLAPPGAVSEREREYASGAVTALEGLYSELAKALQWRHGPGPDPVGFGPSGTSRATEQS